MLGDFSENLLVFSGNVAYHLQILIVLSSFKYLELLFLILLQWLEFIEKYFKVMSILSLFRL